MWSLVKGKKVMKLAFIDFLQFGLKYVFPQKPGSVVRGIPTSHSAAPLKDQIKSSENYVWPSGKGGASTIQPTVRRGVGRGRHK